MGKQLNPLDLMKELSSDAPDSAPKMPHKPKPASVNNPRSVSIEEKKQAAEAFAQGKPSPYLSEHRQKLREREQFSFGRLPRFVIDQFMTMAEDRGMNKTEFLYHLLREQGADIPPYALMDGRRL